MRIPFATALCFICFSLSHSCSPENRNWPLDRTETIAGSSDSSRSVHQDAALDQSISISRAYVCVDNTPVFSDTLFGHRAGALFIGDSVELIGGNSKAYGYFGHVLPGAIYFVKTVTGDSGYVLGVNLGMGWHADTDNEPGDELITARYTSLKGNSEDDQADNPIELQIISEKKVKAQLALTGYSDLYFEFLGSKGFPGPIKFFEFTSGYGEACNYPLNSFLIYFDGQKYQVLTKRQSIEDADVFGVWSDYVFPSDSSGSLNKLTIYDRHFEAEEKDTIRETTRKEVYTYSGSTFRLAERDTIPKPY